MLPDRFLVNPEEASKVFIRHRSAAQNQSIVTFPSGHHVFELEK